MSKKNFMLQVIQKSHKKINLVKALKNLTKRNKRKGL